MIWYFSFEVPYQAEMRNILDYLTDFSIFSLIIKYSISTLKKGAMFIAPAPWNFYPVKSSPYFTGAKTIPLGWNFYPMECPTIFYQCVAYSTGVKPIPLRPFALYPILLTESVKTVW